MNYLNKFFPGFICPLNRFEMVFDIWFGILFYYLWCILCRTDPEPINFEAQWTPFSCILILTQESGPILLIVMTFLDLAAQMTHYFCKQLAFFLIVCKRFYLEAHPFQLAWAKCYNHSVICSRVVTFLQFGQWQAWMVTMLSMDQLWNWQAAFPGYLIGRIVSLTASNITEFIQSD